MTKLNKIRGISAAGLLAVPVILSGCGLFGTHSASEDIDAPPKAVEEQMLNMSDGTGTTGAKAKAELTGTPTTVYLADGNGMLAPVTLGLPEVKDKTSVQLSVETLVSGGAYAKYIPEGFTGVLPAGTEVKKVTVDKDNKLAVVEFNSAFTKYKAPDERKILESLAWTLTGNADVQKVQLWVDGKKLSEMPVGGTPLDQPLSRSMGINLEVGQGATLTNSSPVTVYFSAASPAGIQYYVPVTRLVKPGQDALQSALAELIRGPQETDGLEQVMTDETQLQSVKKEKDGTVTVSLKEDMFAEGDAVPTEMLQSVVLTVAENAGNPKVKIELNGESKVVGTDNLDYSQPVTRPDYINEIPL
ncbi:MULTISPECIES: GerMN domain-containing protein [Paenibacillus]|uniref:GerMN domain-containing protein n=2 Tax=Paenibacillus TaxID=44249 RepID=A0A1R1EEX6_9BACL|nr:MULTISPECIES: GerMN domain-containing protein [Paenibacillus]MBJ9992242.1 GerMN domain-containing protein [Paenibacillus sp. S28]MCM3001906.1 GerMN domain-containing protein [Paenibacillus cellulositrophicus]OMF50357.1 hypothetical protein BK138_27500 [Paenibacillus rhizosphaerae]PQP85708.1 hypothetical protein CPT76_34520 [Paenibacillus sp. AR247]RED31663.1 germination protein M [Paenibacillus sp. VMFN-D1]